MKHLPKLEHLSTLIRTLEANPFGSLVLLCILSLAVLAWLGR